MFYLHSRRQHRLEQEQADIEYEIRLLMAQPERNKPDSDKAREEGLITRLVEVRKYFLCILFFYFLSETYSRFLTL